MSRQLSSGECHSIWQHSQSQLAINFKNRIESTVDECLRHHATLQRSDERIILNKIITEIKNYLNTNHAIWFSSISNIKENISNIKNVIQLLMNSVVDIINTSLSMEVINEINTSHVRTFQDRKLTLRNIKNKMLEIDSAVKRSCKIKNFRNFQQFENQIREYAINDRWNDIGIGTLGSGFAGGAIFAAPTIVCGALEIATLYVGISIFFWGLLVLGGCQGYKYYRLNTALNEIGILFNNRETISIYKDKYLSKLISDVFSDIAAERLQGEVNVLSRSRE